MPTSQAAPSRASARAIGCGLAKVRATVRHIRPAAERRAGIIQPERPVAAATPLGAVAAAVEMTPIAAAARSAVAAVVRRGAIGRASRIASLRRAAPATALPDARARSGRQGGGSASASPRDRAARSGEPAWHVSCVSGTAKASATTSTIARSKPRARKSSRVSTVRSSISGVRATTRHLGGSVPGGMTSTPRQT